MLARLFHSLGNCRAKLLKKVELCIILLVVWICLMTLHYQNLSVQQFYFRTRNKNSALFKDSASINSASMLTGAPFTKLKPGIIKTFNKVEKGKNITKIRPPDLRKKDLIALKKKDQVINKKRVTVKNSTDVLKWFEKRPKFIPFKTDKKHPHLPMYKLPKRICMDGQVHILIYMHSRGNAWHHRDELRTSWASREIFRELKVERIFLISSKEPEEDDELSYHLDVELSKNDDMVMVNEIDSFENLGYKALALLDLVNSRCQQVKYILKADDDMFVNPFMLVENLISTIWNKPRTVMCHLKEKVETILVKESRWYIPQNVLPDKKSTLLPTFCSGYTVLFTADLVPLMLEASYTAPFVKVDDIYMFGFLLHKVKNVKFVNIMHQLTLNRDIGVQEYTNKNKTMKLIAVNAWGKDVTGKLWNSALSRLSPLGENMAHPRLVPRH